MSDKYNGWTNYETWSLKLWIYNDQGSDAYWREAAREAWNEAEADRTFSRKERAAFNLAERLKSETEEAAPELEPSFFSDVLNAAIGEVNWHEIAKEMINELGEDAEEETEQGQTAGDESQA